MITKARLEYLPAINEIYNQAVAEGLKTAHTNPTSLEERRDWFKKYPCDRYPVFVYLTDQKPAGWLSVSPYRFGREALDTVVEVSYYIDYNHHGKGIASQLMDHAIDFCSQSKYRILVAILISGNEPSIGLLKKFGFQEGGRIPGAIQYQGEVRDHLYMYKLL
ncbi:MAG TPA: GNAT family N-acetyltransferase [Balneolaceae bacterium]